MTPADACVDALAPWTINDGSAFGDLGGISTERTVGIVLAALRSLPIEQRLEAVGLLHQRDPWHASGLVWNAWEDPNG